MGVIRVETGGSFGRESWEFSASEHGHAKAISDAIRWLVDKLPQAIRQDHDLHEKGMKPDGAFGKD